MKCLVSGWKANGIAFIFLSSCLTLANSFSSSNLVRSKSFTEFCISSEIFNKEVSLYYVNCCLLRFIHNVRCLSFVLVFRINNTSYTQRLNYIRSSYTCAIWFHNKVIFYDVQIYSETCISDRTTTIVPTCSKQNALGLLHCIEHRVISPSPVN